MDILILLSTHAAKIVKTSRPHLARLFVACFVFVPPILLVLNLRHWPYFFVLGLLASFVLFYPAVRCNCKWFGPVVTRFRTDRKEVWLTIDDGPHPHDTQRLLELLKQHGARATFFMIGKRVEQYPELARAVIREGHQIANHSETHPVLTFWCLPERRLAREVDGGAKMVEKISGPQSRFFRAPAGMANLFLHALLRERGMKLIGWSARGFDGLRRNPKAIVATMLRSVKPGAIILTHEGKRDDNGSSVNVTAIELLLKQLNADGYSFTIPSEDRFL